MFDLLVARLVLRHTKMVYISKSTVKILQYMHSNMHK